LSGIYALLFSHSVGADLLSATPSALVIPIPALVAGKKHETPGDHDKKRSVDATGLRSGGRTLGLKNVSEPESSRGNSNNETIVAGEDGTSQRFVRGCYLNGRERRTRRARGTGRDANWQPRNSVAWPSCRLFARSSSAFHVSWTEMVCRVTRWSI
jgi:hypothetical protein